ncbi:MAG TPA: dihydrodipicolinate synthase family protein [Kribbella sp.]|uniref:dihydrodipicolinate synthase family protein n=1 Tax=Kribbella sp. TaxID=1871183 RepID=UPI002D782128|nr:dihydrodipicolinate synthase family protein [Kribbella sp.]HET6294172.1 dihydrodipicolinate synthase family protein [Kribbella sp.]
MPVDGKQLLAGVMIPLVTPMSAPGQPTDADDLLDALAAAGARSLMLFGSNGEGPLLPISALAEFAGKAAARWRELTGGPVLCNVTAAGTAEALERAAAVADARPDALVLSPPIYFHHRDDEIVSHYAAVGELGVPLVAYNAPRYSNPLSPALIDVLIGMPQVIGIKDSSGDLDLLSHIVSAARRRSDFGVSQGAETQLLAALRLGADGIVPGIANLAARPAVELVAAHAAGRASDAVEAQRVIDRLVQLHSIRPGVPAIKAVLADRKLCPPYVAAPLLPCTEAERRDLIALLSNEEPQLLTRR